MYLQLCIIQQSLEVSTGEELTAVGDVIQHNVLTQAHLVRQGFKD